MSSYDSALKKQQSSSQARVDDLIPKKNAVPLIVTSPYSNPCVIFYPNPWILESELCCDDYTAKWLSNDTIDHLSSHFSSLGIAQHHAEYPRFRLDYDPAVNSFNPDH